jgi:hypothetical protein
VSHGINVPRLIKHDWDYESTGQHERPVPIIPQAEQDLYSRLSHKPSLQPQERLILRLLHEKISYRERFELETA